MGLKSDSWIRKKSLEENKGVVSEDEEKAIIDVAAELEEMLKKDDVTKEQIDEKVKELSEKSHKLAEAMYKKEQEGGAKADNNAKKDDDDVIDAEVE